MDAIDKQIVEILQRDASLSHADLGERVGPRQPPAGGASRRLRRRAS
jgi:DNA-binding Lrp family transcriptional regulator